MTKTWRQPLVLLLLAVFLGLAMGNALAAQAEEKMVGRDEFIRQLGGEEASQPGPVLRLRGPAGTKQALAAQPKELAVSIHFKYDSAEVADEFSRRQLIEAGEALASSALRGFGFEIGGHTDGVGAEAYNMELSLKRARAVKDALCRGFAVDCAKLSIKGYGKSMPLASNEDEAGRAKNRRVVFKRME